MVTITQKGIEKMFESGDEWEKNLEINSPSFFSAMCTASFGAAELERPKGNKPELRDIKTVLGYVFGSVYYSNGKNFPKLDLKDYTFELEKKELDLEKIIRVTNNIISANKEFGDIIFELVSSLKPYSSFVVCALVGALFDKISE